MFNLSVFDFERHDVAGEAFSGGNKISIGVHVDDCRDNLTLNTSQWSRGYMGTIRVAGCGMETVWDKMWSPEKGEEMELATSLAESRRFNMESPGGLAMIIGITVLLYVWVRIIVGAVWRRHRERRLRAVRRENLSELMVYELFSGNRKININFRVIRG